MSGVELDWILVLRSQFFENLREPFYKHALEYLEAARLETKWVKEKVPTVNFWLILTSVKACDWSGHIFDASAIPGSFTKLACHIRVAIACGIRGWRNLGFYAWTSSYNLPVCQLVIVIDDGQQIDRVADTVTLQFRVSYSAISYLLGAFEQRFLRKIYQM